jgi:hypothetical protein
MGHHNYGALEELRLILFLNEQEHLKNQKELHLSKWGEFHGVPYLTK